MINGFACLVLSLTGLLLSQHKNRVSNIAFPVLFRGVAHAVALGNGRKAARASRRSVIVGGWLGSLVVAFENYGVRRHHMKPLAGGAHTSRVCLCGRLCPWHA